MKMIIILYYEIKPFVDHYNWKETQFLSHKKDWKKFDLNDKSFS